MKRTKEHFRGCIVGGAVGDALGWPVEFLLREEIDRAYGAGGIQGFVIANHGRAEITDDTQMTLFTAEGLLRAETRQREKGVCDLIQVVYHAYLRWLHTQGYPRNQPAWIYDGWLLGVKDLYASRAPGNSCLSALQSGQVGTGQDPINDSKGCGGVMRVAPAGLLYPKDTAFIRGCECAAITHGHPSGYLSAGALAYIVAAVIAGEELEEAVAGAVDALDLTAGGSECSSKIAQAMELASSDESPLTAIERLGEGWVGEEAIAISVYCSLKFRDDFSAALQAAVNHDGDSDSTGAITGNVLGAYLGIAAIPDEWVRSIELSEVLTEIADDLLTGFADSRQWWDRYPGY